MRRPAIYALTLILMFASNRSARAEEVAGVEVPPTMIVGDEVLLLNGAGVRTKGYVLKIYVGALYLKERKKPKDAEAIIAADEVMAVRLHLISGLVDGDDMRESTLESIERVTGRRKQAELQKHIDDFLGYFTKQIDKGDVAELVYIPGEGLKIYRNGALLGIIDGGLEFKKLIFGIWLSEKPAHEKLKKGMLGG